MKSEKLKILVGLLATLDDYLFQEGFRRKKTTYGKKTEYYWLVINFQISTDDLPGKLKFTLNIGILDLRLAELLEEPVKVCPDVWACHMRERIGFVMPEHFDKWWVIDAQSPVSNDVTNEFLKILRDFVVPYTNRFSKKDDLLNLWKTGVSPGITDRQRINFIEMLEN